MCFVRERHQCKYLKEKAILTNEKSQTFSSFIYKNLLLLIDFHLNTEFLVVASFQIKSSVLKAH